MKSTARTVTPEEYILQALTPEERLEAALRIAREAFRGATLRPKDIDSAVQKVRRAQYAGKHAKVGRRR